MLHISQSAKNLKCRNPALHLLAYYKAQNCVIEIVQMRKFPSRLENDNIMLHINQSTKNLKCRNPALHLLACYKAQNCVIEIVQMRKFPSRLENDNIWRKTIVRAHPAPPSRINLCAPMLATGVIFSAQAGCTTLGLK
jgi:hypothetical protein